VRRCAGRCRHRAQIVIRDFRRSRMKHQCHGKNSFSLRLARLFERGVERRSRTHIIAALDLRR
jgi:hypothetical protein